MEGMKGTKELTRMADSSQINVPEANRELAYLMAQYGLTPKQAAYVRETILHPEKSATERAGAAGYGVGSVQTNGQERLKTTAMIEAIKAEGLANKLRVDEFNRAIASDARGAIQKELAIHSQIDEIAPNRTRALELLGKMHGIFIDRIELDPGQHTRGRFAEELIIKAKVSGETD